MQSKRVPVPAAFNRDSHERRYYRLGYRDGLRALAVAICTRKYIAAYDAGYDAAREAIGGRECKHRDPATLYIDQRGETHYSMIPDCRTTIRVCLRCGRYTNSRSTTWGPASAELLEQASKAP